MANADEDRIDAAKFRRMLKRPPRYGYVDFTSEPGSVVTVGLMSESGLYPPIRFVLRSVAEAREVSNFLRGAADAEERRRKAKRRVPRAVPK